MFSCLISIISVTRSRRYVQSGNIDPTSDALKRKATVTIIIITSLHIVLSIPMLTNFILWTITAHKYTWPGPFYSSTAMLYYSWNTSDILCLALNSMINPIILLTRIQAYKDWITNNAKKRRSCTCDRNKLDQGTHGLPKYVSENRRSHSVVVKTEESRTRRVTEHIQANPLAGEGVSDSKGESTAQGSKLSKLSV